jgi:hypothetical protein
MASAGERRILSSGAQGYMGIENEWAMSISRNLSELAYATTNPANRGSRGTSIADLRGDGDSGAFGVGSEHHLKRCSITLHHLSGKWIRLAEPNPCRTDILKSII